MLSEKKFSIDNIQDHSKPERFNPERFNLERSISEYKISRHYNKTGLLNAIENGLTKMGKNFNQIDIDDLSAIDEFHIGGRKASEQLLNQINLSVNHEILDIGCGIGGTSRLAASRYSVNVTGIDLSEDFVEIADELNARVGLKDKVKIYHGSAVDMPFQNESFDGAYLMHVGMNVSDKLGLFAEAFRVLRPGAILGIYDVMRLSENTLSYPVPWAESSEICAISNIKTYRCFLEESGFHIVSEQNKRQFALDFFAEQKEKQALRAKDKPMGLNLVMGKNMSEKMANVSRSIQQKTISPIEIIAMKCY